MINSTGRQKTINEPLVSICCITYNHEEFIEDAIKSFLMQITDFKYEILIHDDASTDNTPDIIRKYEKQYPDIIKPILQKENQYSKGVKINKCYNYPRAQGKYIALCEGDDYWIDKNKLQIQVDYMEQHSECSLFLHASDKVDKNKKFLSKINYYDEIHICTTKEIVSQVYSGHTSSMLFPSSLIKCIPDFYFDAPIGDYPLKIYFATKGYVFYMNRTMSVYRAGVGVTSLKVSAKVIKINNERIKKMLNKFNEYTNYQYDEEVNNEIFKRDFKVAVGMNNWNEVRKDKYETLFKALSLTDKARMIIYNFCPIFYKPARKINLIAQKYIRKFKTMRLKNVRKDYQI